METGSHKSSLPCKSGEKSVEYIKSHRNLTVWAQLFKANDVVS